MRSDDRKKAEDGPFEKLGEQVGGFAGRATGHATDMAMNAMGSVIGAAVEVLGDWWSSDSAQKASRSFGEAHERSCRTHYESTGSGTTGSFDQARPLYRFGHLAGQNPDYQGRSFHEVESELRRIWKDEHSSRFGDWPEVRSYIGFGYETTGRRDDPLA